MSHICIFPLPFGSLSHVERTVTDTDLLTTCLFTHTLDSNAMMTCTVLSIILGRELAK